MPDLKVTFACEVPPYHPPPIDVHVTRRSKEAGKYFLILTPARPMLDFPGHSGTALDLEIHPWGGDGTIGRMAYLDSNLCAIWQAEAMTDGSRSWQIRITPKDVTRLFDDDTNRMAVFSLDIAAGDECPALCLKWRNLPDGQALPETVLPLP